MTNAQAALLAAAITNQRYGVTHPVLLADAKAFLAWLEEIDRYSSE